MDTASAKVFLTETHRPTNLTRESTIESMFELFEVQSCYLHVQPVLALFAAGLTSGCVVDSGEFSTTVYPVADGFHLLNASSKLSLGGSHISQLLEKLLLSGNKNAHVQQTIKNHKNGVLRHIKEKLCYIKPSPDSLLTQLSTDTHGSENETNYTLPDGTIMKLRNELSEATESFFDPAKFADVYNYDEVNLPTAILTSILSASMDLRRTLLGSIVLTGGNTNFCGLHSRLTLELKKIIPPGTMATSLKIIDPPDKNNAIWIGGSVLSSLSTFEDQWITEEDYFEYGPEIVHKKCPVFI